MKNPRVLRAFADEVRAGTRAKGVFFSVARGAQLFLRLGMPAEIGFLQMFAGIWEDAHAVYCTSYGSSSMMLYLGIEVPDITFRTFYTRVGCVATFLKITITRNFVQRCQRYYL